MTPDQMQASLLLQAAKASLSYRLEILRLFDKTKAKAQATFEDLGTSEAELQELFEEPVIVKLNELVEAVCMQTTSQDAEKYCNEFDEITRNTIFSLKNNDVVRDVRYKLFNKKAELDTNDFLESVVPLSQKKKDLEALYRTLCYAGLADTYNSDIYNNPGLLRVGITQDKLNDILDQCKIFDFQKDCEEALKFKNYATDTLKYLLGNSKNAIGNIIKAMEVDNISLTDSGLEPEDVDALIKLVEKCKLFM